MNVTLLLSRHKPLKFFTNLLKAIDDRPKTVKIIRNFIETYDEFTSDG